MIASRRGDHPETVVRDVARRLGIPESAFGTDLSPRGQKAAWNPRFLDGGGANANGIEVDAAVLMGNRMGATARTWQQATPIERIEATLVHEYLEHQAILQGVADSHREAALGGVATGRRMGVSPNALKILEEIAAALP